MHKILQARLQQYMNKEIPDVQTGFQRHRGIRDQIAKQRSSRKTFISASLTTLKPFTVWITTNCGKFFKRGECQTILPISWEMCMWVKKQQFGRTWISWLVQNWERSTVKALYYHPAYLTSLQNTCELCMWNAGLDEPQARITIARRNINNLQDADDTILMTESEEELNLLMRVKEESEKAGLKLIIGKTKITASGPITSWQIEGDKNGSSDRIYFFGLQNHWGQWLQPWN